LRDGWRKERSCLFVFTPTYTSPLKGEESMRGNASPSEGEEVAAVRGAQSTRQRGEKMAFMDSSPLRGEVKRG